MPINDAPARGYADWQRTVNYDTGVLYNVARGGATQNQDVSPALDMSRSESIGGRDVVTTADVLVEFKWWGDAALTDPVGVQDFVLSQHMPFAQYRVPNLGPFLQATWTGLAAANFGHTVSLFGTNRSHPLTVVPAVALLHANTAVALAGLTAINSYPASYYAGPVYCEVAADAGAVQFQAQAFSITGGIQQLSPILTPVANVLTPMNFVAPMGAWWIAVNNTNAAGVHYTITTVPSQTGSS